MPGSIRPYFRSIIVAAGAIFSICVNAQTYPAKPITIVVPFAAGSGTDQQARSVAQAMSLEFKVPVIVDNKAGASGFIASQYVAKAVADGYTILLTTNTTHAANEHLFRKIPYDPVKDFTPVTLLSKGYMMVLVNPSSPMKSLTDLVISARKSPGKLNFGSGSSSSRIAGELLKQMAGVDMVNVPYKSNPMAITDLMGGQIDFMFSDTATALPLVASGKLRALAVTGSKRLPSTPAVPTVDESGVKGYEMSYWLAAYLPPNAPTSITKKLNEILTRIYRTPALLSTQEATGSETVTSTPDGLAQFQAEESLKWNRAIKAAGIEPE